MNEATLQQAYNWFYENGYQVDINIDNLCLYITSWTLNLEDSVDILLSPAEVEYRAELYRNSKK